MSLRVALGLCFCFSALPLLLAAACSSPPVDHCNFFTECFCGDGTMQPAGCEGGGCDESCASHGGYDGGRPPSTDGGDGG